MEQRMHLGDKRRCLGTQPQPALGLCLQWRYYLHVLLALQWQGIISQNGKRLPPSKWSFRDAVYRFLGFRERKQSAGWARGLEYSQPRRPLLRGYRGPSKG